MSSSRHASEFQSSPLHNEKELNPYIKWHDTLSIVHHIKLNNGCTREQDNTANSRLHFCQGRQVAVLFSNNSCSAIAIRSIE